MRFLLIFFPAVLAALDLSKAVLVPAPSLGKTERKAVQVLTEEVEKRTWIRLEPGQAAVSISISNKNAGPKEGYSIQTSASGVRIDGNDARGVLFGIGHLLRTLRMERHRLELPDGFSITTAPQYPIRGHQLGYRPKTNSYDGWSLPVWDQYIRDLAIFGTNAIELIPPRSDDDDDSPHFPASKIDTMIGMSRICDEYGLDVWIWYPAMDPDYSKPETVEFALKEWAEVFQKLPRIDAVFVPGGDPGHTQPKFLMPLLEKQAASLRKYHPKAQMWVAPQGFSAEWLDEFYGLIDKQPAWLDGIVFGPQIRVSLAELRKRVPARYPIRHYPDITHSLRAQYAVPNWDPAYQLTLQREPINPRPVDEAQVFRHTQPHTKGFITYSEGCNDDVNKIVWSGLGWNSKAEPLDILRDYARYFIGSNMTEGFAQGLMALERNWRGSLTANEGVYATLRQFEAMDRMATPDQLANWRFQQAQYRAHYDAYTRARLLHETQLEEQALDKLRSAGSLGSVEAMVQAETILMRAVTERAAPGWRARTFELAEALFQSIRMQLSVPWYKAIAVGRGANLDLIDAPLNNRAFLTAQFLEIRGLASERERLARIREILDWQTAPPGGFYDDLGNSAMQPHLVSGLPYADDPAHLQSPLNVVHPRADQPGWRQSWLTSVESRDDSPIRMHYDGLDRAARYRIRIVYAAEDNQFEFRLIGDGSHEVHGWQRKPKPVKPIEFDIPQAATSDGVLDLEFQRKPGMGGAGRAVQVSEVWLVPGAAR
ncbi:MAG: glycoside hydrolase family 20 zincin-like fold domain-containing protein [Bryobacteraceae bacterium]